MFMRHRGGGVGHRVTEHLHNSLLHDELYELGTAPEEGEGEEGEEEEGIDGIRLG